MTELLVGLNHLNKCLYESTVRCTVMNVFFFFLLVVIRCIICFLLLYFKIFFFKMCSLNKQKKWANIFYFMIKTK